MSEKDPAETPAGALSLAALKSWPMIALTTIFLALYAAALVGVIKPLADPSLIVRLEPIILVIIGYYFGRFPSQLHERSLRNEIWRQAHRADAAQKAKEQAQQDREALEEKVKNARVVLAANSSHQTGGGSRRTSPAAAAAGRDQAAPDSTPAGSVNDELLRNSVAVTLSILNS